ncbi:MAG: hypothetical protein FWH04_09495 [Oscillospiraceae bacterium]|nr:hypothetical protein [Oscillospiraceae bacterium]
MPDEEELAERPNFWEMEPEKEPPPVVRPKMTEGERGIFSPQNIWGEGWKVPERQYPDLGSAAEQAQFMLEKIKENAQSPQKSEPMDIFVLVLKDYSEKFNLWHAKGGQQ